jgi:hypothetical protein
MKKWQAGENHVKRGIVIRMIKSRRVTLIQADSGGRAV